MAELGERLGDDVHGGAERDVGGADRRALGVVREAHALLPHRVSRAASTGFPHRLGVRGASPRNSTMPGASEATTAAIIELRISDAAAEAGLLVGVGERLHGGRARRVATARGVTGLDELLVGHDRLRPVDRGDADGEQRETDAEADEEVVVADVDDRAALDREEHVGGDRPDAGRDREVEERVDRADRVLHGRGVLVGHPLAMRRRARGAAPGRRPRRRARARASTKPFRARAGRPRVPW